MIRHIPTKQISAGGSSPYGNPKAEGKMYAGMGALKNHLNLGLSFWYGMNPVLLHLSSQFEPYLQSELIKLDTETFNATYDSQFIPNYLKERACKMLQEKPYYAIDPETKFKLGI
jgi:hypothetical protein